MRAGLLAVAAVLLLGGCADSGMATPASLQESGDGGGSGRWYVADGQQKSAEDAGASGPPDAPIETPAGAVLDGVLGLKPSGAQDIAKARALIEAGQVPEPADLPLVGWLNEHDTPLPPADPSHPIDLHALGALVAAKGQAPDAMLQLGFNSAKSLQDLQPPVAVVVALDRSGSMAGPPLDAARKGLLELTDHLPPGSWLGVLAFGADVTVVRPLGPWQAGARGPLEQALGTIKPSSGTDLHAGVTAGLDALAQAQGLPPSRRLVLITDGASTSGAATATQVVAAVQAAGVPVSAIGYGLQANQLLLEKLALLHGGTYHAAPTPSQLRHALDETLAKMLVEVAQGLEVKLDLAAGWSVQDVYGLPWTQDGSLIVLGKSPQDAGQVGGDVAAPAPDVGGGVDAGLVPNGPKVLQTSLYASGQNGLVIARLQAPDGLDVQKALGLAVATVHWSYKLAKTQEVQTWQRPVTVQGLVEIADGGLAYFTDPIARRAYLILRLGEALRSACQLWHSGQKAAAGAVLDQADALAGAELQALAKEVGDPEGQLARDRQLLARLRSNL